jgi:NAD(P)-dependent dehydrogenase (short-subunit alcohol dehydrogenase family)
MPATTATPTCSGNTSTAAPACDGRRGLSRGAIVNNSSFGSLRGNPQLPAYGAMERAVNSLTESAAAAYGPEGIRVNAIAPGTTLTEMMRAWDEHSPGVIDQLNAHTPLRRAAEPH